MPGTERDEVERIAEVVEVVLLDLEPGIGSLVGFVRRRESLAVRALRLSRRVGFAVGVEVFLGFYFVEKLRERGSQCGLDEERARNRP